MTVQDSPALPESEQDGCSTQENKVEHENKVEKQVRTAEEMLAAVCNPLRFGTNDPSKVIESETPRGKAQSNRDRAQPASRKNPCQDRIFL